MLAAAIQPRGNDQHTGVVVEHDDAAALNAGLQSAAQEVGGSFTAFLL